MQKEPLCTEKGCPCPMSMRTIGSMFAEIKVGTLQRSREHLAKATRRLVMNNSDSAAKPTELSDEQVVKAVYPDAVVKLTGDGYWYVSGALDAGYVQYTPNEAWHAQAEELAKLPQPVQPAPINMVEIVYPTRREYYDQAIALIHKMRPAGCFGDEDGNFFMLENYVRALKPATAPITAAEEPIEVVTNCNQLMVAEPKRPTLHILFEGMARVYDQTEADALFESLETEIAALKREK